MFKELGAVVMAYLQAGLKDKFTQVNILYVFKELGAVVMAYLQADLKDKFTQVNIVFYSKEMVNFLELGILSSLLYFTHRSNLKYSYITLS